MNYYSRFLLEPKSFFFLDLPVFHLSSSIRWPSCRLSSYFIISMSEYPVPSSNWESIIKVRILYLIACPRTCGLTRSSVMSRSVTSTRQVTGSWRYHIESVTVPSLFFFPYISDATHQLFEAYFSSGFIRKRIVNKTCFVWIQNWVILGTLHLSSVISPFY